MAEPESVADLMQKIDALEHRLKRMEAGRPEFGLAPLLRRLLPAESRAHLRNARKEQLRTFVSWFAPPATLTEAPE